MQSEPSYRMPMFRKSFPNHTDDDYKRVEDALEAYLLLTIRFVLDDLAAGRITLTNDEDPSTMKRGSVLPAHEPSHPIP
jgi:hypothetical protein